MNAKHTEPREAFTTSFPQSFVRKLHQLMHRTGRARNELIQEAVERHYQLDKDPPKPKKPLLPYR